jgi:hypothetical protein
MVMMMIQVATTFLFFGLAARGEGRLLKSKTLRSLEMFAAAANDDFEPPHPHTRAVVEEEDFDPNDDFAPPHPHNRAVKEDFDWTDDFAPPPPHPHTRAVVEEEDFDPSDNKDPWPPVGPSSDNNKDPWPPVGPPHIYGGKLRRMDANDNDSENNTENENNNNEQGGGDDTGNHEYEDEDERGDDWSGSWCYDYYPGSIRTSSDRRHSSYWEGREDSDYEVYHHKSESWCESSCSSYSWCRAYEYYHHESRCELWKYWYGHYERMSGFDSYVKYRC